MSDRKERSVNIELVSRSLFLSNIAALPKLRSAAEIAKHNATAALATGDFSKIKKSMLAYEDAERAVIGNVGICNRHFRKAVRAFQIHNGSEAALAVFAKVAEVFPDVPQSNTEALSEYFSVLGDNQDSE